MTVSFVTVVLFLAASFASLVITLVAMKRAMRAQATCVHLNTKLQDELARALRDLLRLNPRARRLRLAEAAAADALRAAYATGLPAAIATARATLTAVRAWRAKLAAEQSAIRAGAEVTLLRYRRELKGAARRLEGRAARLEFGGPRALAVRARPPGGVAPEFEPTADFVTAQAARMSFASDLTPASGPGGGFGRVEHTTTCVMTLEKGRIGWRPKISAASAPSNSRSARSR